MMQTTLFNYFHGTNKPIKPATHKIKSLRQTILYDYFSIKPKKKTVLDYFKHQEEKLEEEKGSKKLKQLLYIIYENLYYKLVLTIILFILFYAIYLI